MELHSLKIAAIHHDMPLFFPGLTVGKIELSNGEAVEAITPLLIRSYDV